MFERSIQRGSGKPNRVPYPPPWFLAFSSTERISGQFKCQRWCQWSNESVSFVVVNNFNIYIRRFSSVVSFFLSNPVALDPPNLPTNQDSCLKLLMGESSNEYEYTGLLEYFLYSSIVHFIGGV